MKCKARRAGDLERSRGNWRANGGQVRVVVKAVVKVEVASNPRNDGKGLTA